MIPSNISLVSVGKSDRQTPKPVFESKRYPAAFTKYSLYVISYLAHFVQYYCCVVLTPESDKGDQANGTTNISKEGALTRALIETLIHSSLLLRHTCTSERTNGKREKEQTRRFGNKFVIGLWQNSSTPFWY